MVDGGDSATVCVENDGVIRLTLCRSTMVDPRGGRRSTHVDRESMPGCYGPMSHMVALIYHTQLNSREGDCCGS